MVPKLGLNMVLGSKSGNVSSTLLVDSFEFGIQTFPKMGLLEYQLKMLKSNIPKIGNERIGK